MRDARIWFEKHAKYISHLDLNRFMLRAVRRAKLPLWVTEGFNPHPYINFALPLSLGFESENDCFDVRITEDMPDEELCERLRAVMPPEIPVTGISAPVYAFKKIEYAAFSLFFESEGSIDELGGFLTGDTIPVRKMGKKARKQHSEGELIDLMEYAKRLDFTAQGESAGRADVILPAGSRQNINPQLLVTAAEQTLGGGLFCKRILRSALLLNDLSAFC